MRFLALDLLLGLFALATSVSALGLLEALANYPELSNLNSKVNGSPVLAPLLGGADGFTFFAPTNSALDSFLKSHSNATQDAAFQALVQYSLTKGGFPRVSFTEKPQFVTSNLNDAKFSNVTGGQVLELVENNGQPQVISGNRSVSPLSQTDIICAGGLVHIIDGPLTLPAQTVNAITAARLSYFVSILTRGGYLSRATNQYVHQVLDSTDVTYFIPNTATALSNFTTKAEKWSEDDLRRNFQYHVVPKYLGYSGRLSNGNLTTAEGSNVTITTRGEDIYVNSAKIIATDYFVSNGVVHVIEDLLDRTNTSPPPLQTSTSSNTSSTSTLSPASTSEPKTTSATTPTSSPSSSDKDDNLTLKVGLGAGLGGAALLGFLILFMVLRRRKKRLPNRPVPNRESIAWDGRSMSTSTGPSNPKRFFVNRDGLVQQRPQQDSGRPGNQMGMVPVTNLEGDRSEKDTATRYYSRGSGGSVGGGQVDVPMRSPSRLQERGYF